ncbi:MAG: MurR/RpiR family transcriptional regulator, partial [Paraburkholderia sp.]|nr:MurR/RpiR family transcriptional regulator [Paraburkholderia sp.]
MSTAFAHTVEASFASLTPTAKRIASYMLSNLERLGLETADQIAQQTGTSGISVGRFLRSVGYRNLDDLKRELRGAQTRPWFITDRLDAWRSERLDGYANGMQNTS